MCSVQMKKLKPKTDHFSLAQLVFLEFLISSPFSHISLRSQNMCISFIHVLSIFEESNFARVKNDIIASPLLKISKEKKLPFGEWLILVGPGLILTEFNCFNHVSFVVLVDGD